MHSKVLHLFAYKFGEQEAAISHTAPSVAYEEKLMRKVKPSWRELVSLGIDEINGCLEYQKKNLILYNDFIGEKSATIQYLYTMVME